MPTNPPSGLDFRDIFFLAPEIVLTLWGFVVLVVDRVLARKLTATRRQRAIGGLSLAGVGIALVAAAVVCFLPLSARAYPPDENSLLSPPTLSFPADAHPLIF